MYFSCICYFVVDAKMLVRRLVLELRNSTNRASEGASRETEREREMETLRLSLTIFIRATRLFVLFKLGLSVRSVGWLNGGGEIE